MKITFAQYPGLTQNIVTLGRVDLSDNDVDILRQLLFLLDQASTNVAAAIDAQAEREDEGDA